MNGERFETETLPWTKNKVVPLATIAFSWCVYNSNNYGFCWWYIYSYTTLYMTLQGKRWHYIVAPKLIKQVHVPATIVIVFVFCLFSKDEHVLPAKNDDVTSKNVPFVLRMKMGPNYKFFQRKCWFYKSNHGRCMGVLDVFFPGGCHPDPRWWWCWSRLLVDELMVSLYQFPSDHHKSWDSTRSAQIIQHTKSYIYI